MSNNVRSFSLGVATLAKAKKLSESFLRMLGLSNLAPRSGMRRTPETQGAMKKHGPLGLWVPGRKRGADAVSKT
jgi:hypothetical protein